MHMVYTHSHFHNAVPIRFKLSEDLCNTFIEGLISTYVGYPVVNRLEQEENFR